MKAFVAILLLAFAKKSFAATGAIACANCEYSNGLGFIADDSNCHVFHRCVKTGNGDVEEVALCCPNGTVWDQDHLACLFGYCASPYPFDVCPPDVENENGTCPFEATQYPKKFKDKLTGKFLYCADGTVFDEEACTCVLGGERTCSPDPLMHFPFAYDYNDVMCHKVQGTRHGDAHLNLTGGYVKLDGDGDYVSFSFLENWFAWRKTKDFLVSVWFRQYEDGWLNINNFPIEGVFGNGDCQQDASIWLTMGNETQQGGIRTDSDQAVFDNYGIDRIARDYFTPLIWCQVAIRYTETEVTLFLNGEITGKRSISGTLANTWAASTIGLTYFDCVPYFWTGCLDDVIIFDRYVGDLEASALFQLGRSEGGDNAPWSDHYP